MKQRVFFSTGLTILELVIVLVVSAILSSIVIPNYTKLQLYAKYSHLKQTAYSIQMAVETFFLSSGGYPELTSIEDVVTLLHDESLIQHIPNNPFTNQPLSSYDLSGKMTYEFDAVNNRYLIEVFDEKNEIVLLILSN